MHSLGDPKATGKEHKLRYSYDYVDREPFGIIRFKYRSRGTWHFRKISEESLHEFCLLFSDAFDSLTVLSCFNSDANRC
jgi:hypothetical protein